MSLDDRFFETFNTRIGYMPGCGSSIYAKYGDEDNEEIRYIPADENPDTINNLMEKSIEQNIDFLWERYKNNILAENVVF